MSLQGRLAHFAAPVAVAAAAAAAAAPAELALASSHVSGAAFGDAAPATALASPAAAADARAHPHAGAPRHCAYSCRAASRAARGGFARDAQRSPCADWRGLAATPSPACARVAFGGAPNRCSVNVLRLILDHFHVIGLLAHFIGLRLRLLDDFSDRIVN